MPTTPISPINFYKFQPKSPIKEKDADEIIEKINFVNLEDENEQEEEEDEQQDYDVDLEEEEEEDDENEEQEDNEYYETDDEEEYEEDEENEVEKNEQIEDEVFDIDNIDAFLHNLSIQQENKNEELKEEPNDNVPAPCKCCNSLYFCLKLVNTMPQPTPDFIKVLTTPLKNKNIGEETYVRPDADQVPFDNRWKPKCKFKKND